MICFTLACGKKTFEYPVDALIGRLEKDSAGAPLSAHEPLALDDKLRWLVVRERPILDTIFLLFSKVDAMSG